MTFKIQFSMNFKGILWSPHLRVWFLAWNHSRIHFFIPSRFMYILFWLFPDLWLYFSDIYPDLWMALLGSEWNHPAYGNLNSLSRPLVVLCFVFCWRWQLAYMLNRNLSILNERHFRSLLLKARNPYMTVYGWYAEHWGLWIGDQWQQQLLLLLLSRPELLSFSIIHLSLLSARRKILLAITFLCSQARFRLKVEWVSTSSDVAFPQAN